MKKLMALFLAFLLFVPFVYASQQTVVYAEVTYVSDNTNTKWFRAVELETEIVWRIYVENPMAFVEGQVVEAYGDARKFTQEELDEAEQLGYEIKETDILENGNAIVIKDVEPPPPEEGEEPVEEGVVRDITLDGFIYDIDPIPDEDYEGEYKYIFRSGNDFYDVTFSEGVEVNFDFGTYLTIQAKSTYNRKLLLEEAIYEIDEDKTPVALLWNCRKGKTQKVNGEGFCVSIGQTYYQVRMLDDQMQEHLKEYQKFHIRANPRPNMGLFLEDGILIGLKEKRAFKGILSEFYPGHGIAVIVGSDGREKRASLKASYEELREANFEAGDHVSISGIVLPHFYDKPMLYATIEHIESVYPPVDCLVEVLSVSTRKDEDKGFNIHVARVRSHETVWNVTCNDSNLETPEDDIVKGMEMYKWYRIVGRVTSYVGREGQISITDVIPTHEVITYGPYAFSLRDGKIKVIDSFTRIGWVAYIENFMKYNKSDNESKIIKLRGRDTGEREDNRRLLEHAKATKLCEWIGYFVEFNNIDDTATFVLDDRDKKSFRYKVYIRNDWNDIGSIRPGIHYKVTGILTSEFENEDKTIIGGIKDPILEELYNY